MRTQVGSVTLPGPVMTASGTAGYGAELAPFMELAELGAVVTKSLAPYEWAGNPAPRVHPTPQGMMNAVGLQGPGIEYWLANVLPDLLATGATVVAVRSGGDPSTTIAWPQSSWPTPPRVSSPSRSTCRVPTSQGTASSLTTSSCPPR